MSLVLVTGASTGLGLATVNALLDDRHDVVLHARSANRVEDPGVLSRVTGTAYADLADLDATVSLAQELDGFGHFDALIHNAARWTAGSPFRSTWWRPSCSPPSCDHPAAASC